MKHLLFTIVLFTSLFVTTEVDAQIQNYPVNFIIKKLVYNQEADRIRMLLDYDIMTPEGQLSGPGTLSMCGCYCDSIWDAWPTEVGGGIPGSGTMYLISDSGGNPPTGIQNGVLRMQQVQGGVFNDTIYFDLATKALLEIQ